MIPPPPIKPQNRLMLERQADAEEDLPDSVLTELLLWSGWSPLLSCADSCWRITNYNFWMLLTSKSVQREERSCGGLGARSPGAQGPDDFLRIEGIGAVYAEQSLVGHLSITTGQSVLSQAHCHILNRWWCYARRWSFPILLYRSLFPFDQKSTPNPF